VSISAAVATNGAAQLASEKRTEKVQIFDAALARVDQRLNAVGDAQ
jgi:hypothetical protein